MRSGSRAVTESAEGILRLAPPRMLRRISTKLVLAVLLAVVLPFVAFAFYINEQMGDRVTRHVVQPVLLGLVKNLAGQLDYFVVERRADLEQWADSQLTQNALDDERAERGARQLTASGEAAPRPANGAAQPCTSM